VQLLRVGLERLHLALRLGVRIGAEEQHQQLEQGNDGGHLPSDG
jgi:hypothetical protein